MRVLKIPECGFRSEAFDWCEAKARHFNVSFGRLAVVDSEWAYAEVAGNWLGGGGGGYWIAAKKSSEIADPNFNYVR